MALLFYKTGKVQAVAEKYGANVSAPEKVTTAMLQTCLSYTLTARLAPQWNKAGHLLIQGEDFLSKSGKQDAVEIGIYVSETQLCISIQVFKIRLPLSEIADFNVSSETLHNFMNKKTSVIKRHFISSNWCYILPSMKMGQIVSISYTIPPESPFKTYEDLEIYWNMLYGYVLPKESSKDMLYCSVYFKLIGERLFTYPFTCIRSQPLQFFPRVNTAIVLDAFLSDLRTKLPNLCGFPVTISLKHYPIKDLKRPDLLYSESDLVNLKEDLPPRILSQATKLCENNSTNCSIETCQEVAPFTHQPVLEPNSSKCLFIKSAASAFLSFGSQSCFALGTQNENLARCKPLFQSTFLQENHKSTKNVMEKKKNTYFRSTSGDEVFCHETQEEYDTTMNLTKKESGKVFTFGSDSQRFIPSFPPKEKNNLKRTNNLEIRALKNKIESFSKEKLSLNQKHLLSSENQPNMRNESVQNAMCVQTCLKGRTHFQITEFAHESSPCFSSKRKKERDNEGQSKKLKDAYEPFSSSDSSNYHVLGNAQKEFMESKPKKLKRKTSIQNVDIEMHARNNQLSKLNIATLQNWLKEHGVSVKTRDKKEALVIKMMQFLNGHLTM